MSGTVLNCTELLLPVQIESLLGAPIEIPHRGLVLHGVEGYASARVRGMVCSALYTAADWLRTALNVFASAAAVQAQACSRDIAPDCPGPSLCPPPPSDLMHSLLQRVAHLLALQDLLVAHVQRYPAYMAAVAPHLRVGLYDPTHSAGSGSSRKAAADR